MPTIFRNLLLVLFLTSPGFLVAQETEEEFASPLPPLSFGSDFVSVEWTQFGRVGAHLGQNFRFNGTLPLSKVWSKKISFSRKGETYANAVSRDGLLHVLDAKGVVWAFDLYEGDVVWKEPLRDRDYSNVGGGLALGDLLYVVDGDGGVYGMDPDSGEVFWWQNLGSPVSVPPLWKGGNLYLVDQDSTVYSLQGSDGKIIWSQSGIPQNRVLMNHGAPGGAGRFVIVPFSSGEIKALSILDGKEIWSKSMLLSKGGNPSLLPAVSAPVVDIASSRVFYTSQAYEVGALNLADGTPIWEVKNASSVHMPMMVGENILVITRDERLLVLNGLNGEEIWNVELPFQSPDSGQGFLFFRKSKQILVWHVPIVADDKIFLLSYKGHLVVYEGRSGEILSMQNLIDEDSKERITSPPIWVNETLYVISDRGIVSAWR